MTDAEIGQELEGIILKAILEARGIALEEEAETAETVCLECSKDIAKEIRALKAKVPAVFGVRP